MPTTAERYFGHTAIILDPSVDGTSYEDSTSNTWQVEFPDYTLSGISSCNQTPGAYGRAYPEYNNSFDTETTGEKCWCRMTSPVRSAWVFRDTLSPSTNCQDRCAGYCGDIIRRFSDFRIGMYTSAGN